jgi:hypothetical protein
VGNPAPPDAVFKDMTRILLAVAVAAATVVIAAPAEACHSFTVSVSPASPYEGGSVTVTVSRESAGSPSNVHVFTTDETARAPADYAKVDQQVYFQGDTSKSFQVPIKADSLSEGTETFRVGLDNPGGCTTSGLETGSDARVSIREAGSPAPRPTYRAPLQTAPPIATYAPGRTTPRPLAAGAPTPSATPTPTATATATETPFSAFPSWAKAPPAEEAGGSLPLWPVFGLAAAAAVTGGGAWLLWYKRRVA